MFILYGPFGNKMTAAEVNTNMFYTIYTLHYETLKITLTINVELKHIKFPVQLSIPQQCCNFTDVPTAGQQCTYISIYKYIFAYEGGIKVLTSG